jgi:hypothetical protein
MATKAFDQEQINRLVPMKRAGTSEVAEQAVLASESAGLHRRR